MQIVEHSAASASDIHRNFAMSTSSLSFKDLCKKNDVDALILDSLDGTFYRGEIGAVIGSNGAGKSTLLKCLASILVPDRGHISLSSHGPIRDLSRQIRSRTIAWVPTQHDIPFAYRVKEIVVMGRFPWHAGNPTDVDWQQVSHALSQLGCQHLSERAVTTLSSGELSKIMIARALCLRPEILLLDEPSACLDLNARGLLYRTLQRLASEGMTIIIATHDLALCRHFADRIQALQAGKCLFTAPTSHVSLAMLREVYQLDEQHPPGLLW